MKPLRGLVQMPSNYAVGSLHFYLRQTGIPDTPPPSLREKQFRYSRCAIVCLRVSQANISGTNSSLTFTAHCLCQLTFPFTGLPLVKHDENDFVILPFIPHCARSSRSLAPRRAIRLGELLPATREPRASTRSVLPLASIAWDRFSRCSFYRLPRIRAVVLETRACVVSFTPSFYRKGINRRLPEI